MKRTAPYAALALALTVCWAIYHDRAVSVSAGGLSLAIMAPPEIEGRYERTDTGWIVHGRAVIRATMANGTIREIVVPHGQTRRVVVREGVEGMRLEVVR